MLSHLIPDNPVLIKELRVRMRGARAYWILFGYLGFVSFVLLGNYFTWQSSVNSQGAGSSGVAEFGSSIFATLIVTQMFLVLFITPAITSGSLTIEKEQRTLEMLTMTRMPRRSIIVGKLLAAVLFTSLLVISSLPLISICFMLGSIDPSMVISTYMELLFGSFAIGAMGLMWSSIAKTTTLAVLFTYGSLMVLFAFGALTFTINRSPFGSASAAESAIRAVAMSMFGDSFLGLHGLDGIGFTVIASVSGVLMSAIAMSRLEMFPERKATLLRGLSALLCGIVAFEVDSWWLQSWYHRTGQSVAAVVQPPIGALIVTTVLLMLLVPIFATGELLPYETRRIGNYLRHGWTPAGLRRGKLSSGLPSLLLMTALLLALYVVSFAVEGKSGDLLHSAALPTPIVPTPRPMAAGALSINGKTIQSRGTVVVNGQQQRYYTSGTVIVNGQQQQYSTVNGRMTLIPPQAAQQPMPPQLTNQVIGDFPQAALMLAVFVVGFSLFCLLLSVICRNRWFAWAAATVCLLVLWIAPEQGKAPTLSGLAPEPTVCLFYLNPEQALLQMSDPSLYWTSNKSMGMALQPMWLRVTQAWAAIGGVSLLLTFALARRQSSRNVELPYEAQIAEA